MRAGIVFFSLLLKKMTSSLQIRQRCDHHRTLFYLEQLVLKSGIQKGCTDIKPMPRALLISIHSRKGNSAFSEGMDFFFTKRQSARRLVEYIDALLPCRYHYAQELVTHDPKNNVYDYKHTYCVEIVPVCKVRSWS